MEDYEIHNEEYYISFVSTLQRCFLWKTCWVFPVTPVKRHLSNIIAFIYNHSTFYYANDLVFVPLRTRLPTGELWQYITYNLSTIEKETYSNIVIRNDIRQTTAQTYDFVVVVDKVLHATT